MLVLLYPSISAISSTDSVVPLSSIAALSMRYISRIWENDFPRSLRNRVDM